MTDEITEVTRPCPNCESAELDNPVFFWKKAKVCEANSMKKTTDGIMIYCALCNRVITVIPTEPVSVFE